MALNQTSTPFLPTSLLVADLTKFTGITGAQATSPDSVPTLTINPTTQLPVSAALEIQSTDGLLLVPRLTDVQYAALITPVVPRPQVGAVPDPGNVINGMIYYNSDDENFVFYQNGAPVILPTGGGTGNVVGVNSVTAGTLAYYNSTDGLLINQTSIGNLGGFNVLADELVICGTTGTANQVATYVGTAQTGGGGAIIQAATVTMTAGNIANVSTIQAAIGAVGAPSYTFTAHATTGLFAGAAGTTLDFTIAGAEQFQITGLSTSVNFLTVSGAATTFPVILGASGTDANISIEFLTKGTGGYSFQTVTNGQQFQILDNGATAVNNLAVTGSATTVAPSISALGTDTNISILLTPKGTGALLNAVGAVATPAYSFTGRANTGLWSSGVGVLDLSAAGTRALQLTSLNVAADEFIRISSQLGNGGSVIAAASSTAANAVNMILTPQNIAGSANASAVTVTKGTGATTGSGILFLLNTSGTGGSGISCNDTDTTNSIYLLPSVAPTVAGQQLVYQSTIGGAYQLGFSSIIGVIQSASGTILNAAAQAAYTTPIALIPASGDSTMIIVERASFEFVGAAPFVGAGNFVIEYGNVANGEGDHACGNIANASFVGLSASTILFSNPTVASVAVADNTNLGVWLSADTTNFTGGGALNYTIQYYIINVT